MRGASFFTRQSRVSASLKKLLPRGAEGAVFARLASGLLRYCEATRSGPFPRKQESGSPIWSPRARAPFPNRHQTAGKQPRLSRGFSMGP